MRFFLFTICILNLNSQQITPNNVNPNAKQGNGSRFQLAVPYTGLVTTPICNDANGNITNVGCPVVPLISSLDYNYTPQTPHVNLTAGVLATIPMIPCPRGVVGTDANLRFWISGGTGTAESVANTGTGTCTSGGSGNVKFTPANNHSGNWTISSSFAGIYEADIANPYKQIKITGTNVMHDCMTLNPNRGHFFNGDGFDPSGALGTKLEFGSITSAVNCANASAISVVASVGYPIYPTVISNLLVVGNGTVTPVINGITATNMTRATIDTVMISGFAGHGINTNNSFEVHIRNCYIQLNGKWGTYAFGLSNLSEIVNNYYAFNGRSNGFGNLAVSGNASPGISTPIHISGNAIEGAGIIPFTTVTVAFGLYVGNVSSPSITGNYIEFNLGGSPFCQVLYAAGFSSLFENGNLINSAGTSAAGICYDATLASMVSQTNTFYGPTANRIFLGTDKSMYVVGPDACFAGSTECTDHPHLVGNIGLNPYTYATLPASTNGTIIYCSDCNSTCSAGSSTGRTCFRENGAWGH